MRAIDTAAPNMIGDVHAVCFVLTIANHANRLMRQLKAFVETVDAVYGLPQAAAVSQTKAVLEHMLLSFEGSDGFPMQVDLDQVNIDSPHVYKLHHARAVGCKKLLLMLNGHTSEDRSGSYMLAA